MAWECVDALAARRLRRQPCMEELPVCAIGDTQRCAELMHQHGVVVFRNVLTSEEIKTSEQKFWDWAERAAPGLKRNDPKTHADLGKMGWGDTGIVAKQRPASRGAAAPSRHRRDSCPSDEAVALFWVSFEQFRTASRDRDAPRRSRTILCNNSSVLG